MPWVKLLEVWILNLSAHVSLPAFITVGEVVEEIISPIPSQLVLITGGTIAQAQHWSLFGVVALALLASVVKTAATLIYYLIADKLEDTLLPKIGKYIGISHEDIESFGKKLHKGKYGEFLTLLVIRCLPIIPSVPVSVMCGLFKINFKTFVLSTLLGNFIRGLIVLLTGYLGFDVAEAFANGILTTRTIVISIIVLILLSFIVWGYYKRYKGEPNAKKK